MSFTPFADGDAATPEAFNSRFSEIDAGDVSSLATGTYDSQLTLANANNVYFGDGSNLTGVVASSLTTGTYASQVTFSNTGNVYYGSGANLTGIFASGLKDFIDVTSSPYLAAGDGVTDDTSAITTAIASSRSGALIYFPPGTYLVSAPIVLKGARHYKGTIYDVTSGAIIKQKAGSNISGGLLVADGYVNNGTDTDSPVIIEDLYLDGNDTNNSGGTTHGLQLMNWNSRVEGVHVRNFTGDGIRWEDQNSNGSTLSTTQVENHLVRNFVRSVLGAGIRILDNDTITTDGWCVDNSVSSTGEDGIDVQVAGGWNVRGNKVYDIGFNGIKMTKATWSVCADNQIDDYGDSATTGLYAGIKINSALAGTEAKATVVNGNVIHNKNAVAGSTYYGIQLTAATSNNANVSAHGNHLKGNNSGTDIAFRVVPGTGGLAGTLGGNSIASFGIEVQDSSTNSLVRDGTNSWEVNVTTLVENDATPNVGKGSIFVTNNTSTTTVTTLDNAAMSPRGTIVMNDNKTVFDFTGGGNMVGNGGANWSANTGDVLHYVYSNGTIHCNIVDTTA